MSQVWYQKASVQVAIVTSVGLIIVTLITVAYQRSELREHNVQLRREVAERDILVQDLKNERDKLDIKLASFQAAADKVFPDQERHERLDLLLKRISEQIDSMTKWTTSFQPLNQDDAARFVAALKTLAAATNATAIRVQCESGSTARRQYGQQLGTMLAAAGIGHFADGIIIGFAPDGQIVCLYSSDRESFVREFLKLLGSWTDGQVKMQPKQRGDSMIIIHINGTPSFDSAGKVKMM
jgi:hypothetical protein